MWDTEKLILILARFSAGVVVHKHGEALVGAEFEFSLKLGQRFCGYLA